LIKLGFKPFFKNNGVWELILHTSLQTMFMEEEMIAHPGAEKITSGSHSSYWIESVEPLAFRKLEENIEVDVVIVGGGIAGISTAYCLTRSGKKVAVIEDGFIGSGETGRTTAHLVSALDDRFYELERMYGEEKTKLIAQSHKEAVDFVEDTVEREKIDCDFERIDGFLFLHPSDDVQSLVKEWKAADKAGLEVEQLDQVPVIKNYNGPGLRFGKQAQFHPLKYIKGLCTYIEANGGKIYTGTHAKSITPEGVTSDKGFKVSAKYVVVATNTPVNNWVSLHFKQYPYRTYVLGAKIPKDSIPPCLWWDTGDFEANKDIPPYHYIRTQRFNDEYDLLIVGGEDHATGLADIEDKPEEERYKALEQWAKRHFGVEDFTYRWSGQIMETMDSLAFIGKNPHDKDNVFVVTGDSGNGMTHGTIAGQLIDDLINGRENKYAKIYDPSRFKLFTAGNVFFKEMIAGFKNYLKTKKKDAHQEIRSIKKNEGKIVELNGKKYGVYCDEQDQLHYVDAVCTHLKCIIRWNNDEKSWDCPCHGSRFTIDGKVMNGPANDALPYHRESKNDPRDLSI
jgi:glycine/D-amino acid oxidase-like deaminating enzyme/nitrite reductase/ring-hydroxylating ferredoxin subunit